ncbi:MAG: T9SS type A sorting domain-containing protein [Flavobacteriales bacterium]|nr:T9SS type A sorting domain-containing protein [Flavobacteriales bacterium]
MKNTFLLLGLLLSSTAQAQITIGELDMPSPGDTMRFRSFDGQTIALDQTGPDHVWDLGDLTPLEEVADTAVTVGSTPFLYQFFFNNGFLYPQYVADYAMKGPSLGFQALSLQDVYDYYRADADGFRNVGFGATVNGLPTSVRRDPIDRILNFPLDFGDSDVSTSAFNVSVPTLLYFGQDQVRTNTVDGWGTLVLPSRTFDVLRVRTVLERTDTIFIEQFGFGFRLPEPETVEYKWYALGMDAPVLQVITTGGIIVSARFFHEPDITTGLAMQERENFLLYPNPANAEVFIRSERATDSRIVLRDAAGREVFQRTSAPSTALLRVDLSGLASGIYSVQLIDTHGSRTQGLIVE